MKRLFAALMAVLMLLSGCAKEPEPTPPSQTTEPTIQQPTGLVNAYDPFYQPDSSVEVQTHGAVKKYVLDLENPYGISEMRDGLLIFSGTEDTVLTWLGAEDECYSAVISGCYLYPDGMTTHVSDEGVCYFDAAANAVVTLDHTLQEITRVSLPQLVQDTMVLSSDGEKAYYFGDGTLRWIELRTGISRMLKEMSFDYEELTGLHFRDGILECAVEKDGSYEVLYISAETGETLFSALSIPELETEGNRFFAKWKQGSVSQWIFGERGEKEKCLLLEDEQLTVSPLFAFEGAVTQKEDTTGTTLTYYDLNTGLRSASMRVSGVGQPLCIAEDTRQNKIWFLAYGTEADSPVAMYSWEPALSPTEDSKVYLSSYYTELEPDEAGLKEIENQADALADQYNIRIQVWHDALNHTPSDYTFTAEHLVQAYRRYLPVLEETLSQFPEGFFKKLGSQSNNRKLTISLIRNAHGSNELGSLDEATGVHFWDNGNSYLALTLGDHIEQTFYHELFHSIDSYILTETQAFDDWDDLNPDGFQYDFSYVTNQYREDYQYLEDGTRAFIDMYSMSYPKEDRARIMEYAIMDDCAHYFASDTMQAKLKTLCKGIREAFGLRKDSRVFLWEQYLAEPLAYQK